LHKIDFWVNQIYGNNEVGKLKLGRVATALRLSLDVLWEYSGFNFNVLKYFNLFFLLSRKINYSKMKQISKLFLIIFIIGSCTHVKANFFKNMGDYSYPQDTVFYGAYTANSDSVYMYSEPNLSSLTKTKFPKHVVLSVTKKSGNFIYGKFNLSANENFEGWFLVAQLRQIFIAPPKPIH